MELPPSSCPCSPSTRPTCAECDGSEREGVLLLWLLALADFGLEICASCDLLGPGTPTCAIAVSTILNDKMAPTRTHNC